MQTKSGMRSLLNSSLRGRPTRTTVIAVPVPDWRTREQPPQQTRAHICFSYAK